MSRGVPLDAGWQLARAAPGSIATPADAGNLQWLEARVPGTVASALQVDAEAPGPYDADDWWYRNTFARPATAAGAKFFLKLDGLATLAQVWFNGRQVLESSNMFLGHRIDVTDSIRDVNEVAIRFASLGAALARRRPRPRWRTALVNQQNLRWIRTTLLGRIPAWTPPIAPVGPWCPITLECVEGVDIADFALRAQAGGLLQVSATVASHGGDRPEAARLRVGSAIHPLPFEPGAPSRIATEVVVPDAPAWWPHTHGAPRLVECVLEIRVGGAWIEGGRAKAGFRDIALDATGGRVQFTVNGVAVFCRGAVWTPLDILSLRGEPGALRRALESVRDLGLNMLRVGGTMVYESDDFYRLCDELGILVWQDFMFANMDYPVADAAFRSEVEAEARYQLARLRNHPCVAAYCGGSEVAQQAAMMGLPPDQWSNELFDAILPRLCGEIHAGVPYFPSTPWGGPLPFHVGSGISHYYGVGAYRRPLADARLAGVKFATECLGFSNLPERSTTDLLLGGATPPPHHPRWKARVPRDNGAGYDFEDVRDHYLGQLFGRDAIALRSQDLERYWAVSRVVTGEVMLRTFAEWRSPRSQCGGALVWFLRDLWPGAGWGVVDSTGLRKAAAWYLKRAWASRGAWFTDEGLDGLAIHVVNEEESALQGTLELRMYRHGRDLVASAEAPVEIPGRGALTLHADAVFGRFTDGTNAYRFGPSKQDLVVMRLRAAGAGAVIAEDFHFPLGLDLPLQAGTPDCSVDWIEGGRVAVTIRSAAFLQSVCISSAGWEAEDNYFHVAPGQARRVLFSSEAPRAAFRADLEALNLGAIVALHADRPG